MPLDGEGATFAIHATAVAIDGRALLIRGPSRAGKSRLAFALMAASRARRPVRLIGDDRILLKRTSTGLSARPHPRIAGFIERRGLGIVAMSHVAMAPVGGIVALGACSTLSQLDAENFPVLRIVDVAEMRADGVIQWWDHVQTATYATHFGRKAAARARTRRKD